jgi:hypothetical protein
MFYFYHKNDKTQEPIKKAFFTKSRLSAAKYFAELKQMKLREFLKIFGVSK